MRGIPGVVGLDGAVEDVPEGLLVALGEEEVDRAGVEVSAQAGAVGARGATADAVAKALGHSSFAITEQHYASPSSIANNRASRVTAALSAARPNPTEQLDLLLKSMSTDELSELLSRLTEKRGQSHPSDDIERP